PPGHCLTTQVRAAPPDRDAGTRAASARGAALAALVLAVACAPAPERAAAGIVDDFGDTLRLAASPRRIVSLNPTTTELLFALGAGERVVGRTHWDQWPDSARLVPDLGNGLRPNVEAVLARRPDLVLLYASGDNRDAANRLRAAGVPTLALRIDSIAEFRRAVVLLSVLVGDSARGTRVRDSVDRTLSRVRLATAPLPPPRVMWHVWDSPLIVIGGGSYLTELVAIAGARNVYADQPAISPQVSMEDIVRRDPDYIIAGPVGRERVLADPRWRGVRAVRDGRVVAVDTNLVGRPSVRLGEAAVELARLLHPGLSLP
ncbi:MAG TPA: helical backbone metal receptor, partial [Gemmatimonadaceae bacterium]|nr:helical backbone metal receptor [Gemmatimonadaceae bacterium]